MTDVAKLLIKVGADIKDAQRGLQTVHHDVEQTTGSMGRLGKAAGLALAGAVVAGAAAAAAGMGIAAKAAMDFEHTMSGVKAVSGASGAEMRQLNDLALQLGKDTVFSAGQAGMAIEELVKGGVSVQDVMTGAAEATVNLAAAGGVDLASAAEIAANAMSMFNLEGTDMAMVADLIAGAANASSLNVQDFRLSLQQVGAVATTAGQDFRSTAEAIAVMGKAGLKSSDAGTSLKQMLLNLQPTTTRAVAVMERLGIATKEGGNQFFDASGKAKSMRDIAEVLQTATAGLTEEERLLALELMFGSDAMRAAAVLSKAGAEGFDTMAASMSKVTAESVAAERLNNLAGDLEQLKGSAETLAITLGQELQPQLRSATQAATGLLDDAIEVMPAAIGVAQLAISDFSDMVGGAGDSLAATAGMMGISADEALPTLAKALKTAELVWADLTMASDEGGWSIVGAAGSAATAIGDFLGLANSLLQAAKSADVLRQILVALPGSTPISMAVWDSLADAWARADAQVEALRASTNEGKWWQLGVSSSQIDSWRLLGEGVNKYADTYEKLKAQALSARQIAAQNAAIEGEDRYLGQVARSAEKATSAVKKTGGALAGIGDGAKEGASETEKAMERAIDATRDAGRAIEDTTGALEITLTKLEQSYGDRWIEQWFEVNAAILKTSDAAAQALQDVREDAATALLDLQAQSERWIEEQRSQREFDIGLQGLEKRYSQQKEDARNLWSYEKGIERTKEDADQDSQKLRKEAEKALIKAKSDEEQKEIKERLNADLEAGKERLADQLKAMEISQSRAREDLAQRRKWEDEDALWREENIEKPRRERALAAHNAEVERQRESIIDARDAKLDAIEEERKERIAAINSEWEEWQKTERAKTDKAKEEARNKARGELLAIREEYFDKLADSAAPGLDALKAEIEARFGSALASVGGVADSGGGGGGWSEGVYTDPRHQPEGDIFETWKRNEPEQYAAWAEENGMASGGIVTGPTPAIIGEAGPEAVIPLDRSGGIIDYEQLGQVVARAVQGMRVEMDGVLVARVVATNLEYAQARRFGP